MVDKKFTKILWSIDKAEIDMVNVLINIVERNDSFDPDIPFDYHSLYYMLETNMHELSSSLGFKELSIDHINQILDSLSSKVATIYYEDGLDRIMKKGPFVQEFTITSSNKDVNKRIQVWLNTRLIKIFREDKKMFDLFYRFTKYNLKSKYSRILYEMFSKKDKSSLKISVDDLTDELDYELSENKQKTWSRLNSNILKRAVAELDLKSNLTLRYDKIKDKDEKDNRVKTSMIKIEAILAPEMEEPDTYFSNEFLLSRKIDYYLEREVERRYSSATRFGTITIYDENAYKAKMRRELRNSTKEYEARVLLQEWINIVKYNHLEIDGLVALENFAGYEFVTVNNEYILVDVKTRNQLSMNAIDTREKIKRFLNDANGDYTIVETTGKIKDCSISYTKG